MIDIRVHAAEAGGNCAEVLNLPGCASQGETLAELTSDIGEAIEGCGLFDG